MSHPYHHARSSARKFGGTPDDYLAIHRWFDQTKAHVADARHRLILHNSFGIFLCEQVFGVTIKTSFRSDTRVDENGTIVTTGNYGGKEVPVRLVAEQHVLEDFGYIPTLSEVLELIPLDSWMFTGAKRLSDK